MQGRKYSDPNFVKDASYNFKHFPALKLIFKNFSDLKNTILQFKHFQGFQAPIRTLHQSVVVHILFTLKNIYLPTMINRGVSGNETVICTKAGVADT